MRGNTDEKKSLLVGDASRENGIEYCKANIDLSHSFPSGERNLNLAQVDVAVLAVVVREADHH